MREFIRHPTTVPIQISELESETRRGQNTLNNVSMGGVSCFCDDAVEIGNNVSIRVECVDPNFELTGKAVWCKEKNGGYEVGIEFLASKQKMFLLRMVEQICHIEHYRKEIARVEGRELSSEQAAQEWIKKYAESFPR